MTRWMIAGGVLAVVIGVPLGFVSLAAAQGLSMAMKQSGEPVFVVLAIRDLEVGHTITEDDLFALEMPERLVFAPAFFDPEHVVGLTLTQPHATNAFISPCFVTAPADHPGQDTLAIWTRVPDVCP